MTYPETKRIDADCKGWADGARVLLNLRRYACRRTCLIRPSSVEPLSIVAPSTWPGGQLTTTLFEDGHMTLHTLAIPPESTGSYARIDVNRWQFSKLEVYSTRTEQT